MSKTPKPSSSGAASTPLMLLGLLIVGTLLFGPVKIHAIGFDEIRAAGHSLIENIQSAIRGPEPAPPATVASLRVHRAGSLAGYSRAAFGPAWADVNRNGCDTRNDILARDLSVVTTEPGTHDCVVITGILHDRYTGATIQFLKINASQVQIDHVVPLAAAWRAGAARWSVKTRTAFANDPVNLLAVDGATNESKGDSTPDAWMPPRHGEACDYARRYTGVKVKYHLGVTAAERTSLIRALATC